MHILPKSFAYSINKIAIAPFILLTLLYYPTSICAQESAVLRPQDEFQLDSICSAHLKEFKVPGMAVGIILNGEIAYAKGFGVTELGTDTPVTPKSIFHMASISKTFVATAIAQLVEQGKIDLDAPVTTYLPYFKLRDERYRDITIRHLLTHTAGVPDANNFHWRKPEHGASALENYVRGLKKRGMDFAPGSKFKYSNNGYEVLGDVIAKASGRSFEDYLKRFVLAPSGMANSTFFKKEVPEELATSPHIKRLKIKVSKTYPYNREHGPSSTLNSNLEDMLNYAITYLNKGTFEGQTVFSNRTYDLLTQPQVPVKGSLSIGLSWFMNPSRLGKEWTIVHHDGEDIGYQSFLGIIPGKSWSIMVFYNADWKVSNSQSIFDMAYDLISKYEK